MVESDSQRTPGVLYGAAVGGLLGSIVVLADFVARLVHAYGDFGGRIFGLPLFSYVCFATSVSSAAAAVFIGFVWLLRGGRSLPALAGWPGVLFLASPAVAAQVYLLIQKQLGAGAVAINVGTAFVLAWAFLKLLRRAPRITLAMPVVWIALSTLAGILHANLAERPPATDFERKLGEARADGRDLLLITLDTTRADHLGCYGYEAAKTPNIDRLGNEGVVFERCFAPNPTTQPSHSSILTGMQLAWHGVHENGTAVIDGQVELISERLAEFGYDTRAVVGSFVLDRGFGFFRGFSVYDDRMPLVFGPGAIERRLARTSLRPSLGSQIARRLGVAAFISGSVEPARTATEVTDAAIASLQESPADRPLFLWVHYWDPHAPYDPPEEFMPAFEPEENPPEGGIDYWFGNIASQAEVYARYDGEIAYLDSEIGRLFEAFAARSERDHAILLTADHGEGLNENGVKTHGLALYDLTLHVPLIVNGSGLAQGGRVERTVASYDVAPTILELAGVPPIADQQARSLLPLDESAPACAQDRTWYHEAIKSLKSGWRADGWMYITYAEGNELYDYERDPKELDNRAEQEPDRLQRMDAQLKEYRTTFPEGRGQPLTAEAGVDERLAQLGYADGAEGEDEE